VLTEAQERRVNWLDYYRIIPSVYPPINFFENFIAPEDMEIAWYIESFTNDRLREQVGDLLLVRREDRICGKGSSVIMAAFTHIGKPSRFSNGSYGVFYAGNSLETAIKETVYHRELFLKATGESAMAITMRVYKGKLRQPFFDIRDSRFKALHHPVQYQPSQCYGEQLRSRMAWGLLYNSVRNPGGECIAAFRPPAVAVPSQTKHLAYVWNGQKISQVYEKRYFFQNV
jgi:hypothetical protein